MIERKNVVWRVLIKFVDGSVKCLKLREPYDVSRLRAAFVQRESFFFPEDGTDDYEGFNLTHAQYLSVLKDKEITRDEEEEDDLL